MNMILTSMNNYATLLKTSNRPQKKFCRHTHIKPFSIDELKYFIALCVLQGQIKYPSIRKMFSMDPLYYAPIFHYKISGRRFEEMLRCFSCCYGQDIDPTDKLNKVTPLLNKLLMHFRNAYHPNEELSLDESLLLFRGRLQFRQYIKGKRARYGIKFYSLCTADGFVLNLQIYKGKSETAEGVSKLEALVLSLMEHYLDRGHHVFMDNFYNSVSLSNKLIGRRTHVTGTLRSNRRGNPQEIIKSKLKKGEHKWRRNGSVYVSKWRDKREVLCITTKYHPRLTNVKNRYGTVKVKPIEIAKYNEYMSGIDRSDQMTSYYSSPRKSVRWYKKVMFHLLDVAIWNSYFIMKKYNHKLTLIEYRELLVKELLGIPLDLKDGRKLVIAGALHGGKRSRTEEELPDAPIELHFPDNIPNVKNPTKSFHMRCRQCLKNNIRKETKYLCKTCPNKPPLCIVPCFESYHRK